MSKRFPINRIASTFLYKGVEYPMTITFSDYVEEDITWLSIFFNARAYYKAGLRCLEPKKLGNGGIESLTLPSIVTYLFSIELFLKSLYLIEQPKLKRGHKVVDLYEKLSTDVQIDIKERFEIIYKQLHKELLFAKDVIEKSTLQDDNGDSLKQRHLDALNFVLNISFSGFLEAINDFFVTVRYDFEKSNNILYMDSLIWILATVLYEILQEKFENHIRAENPLA